MSSGDSHIGHGERWGSQLGLVLAAIGSAAGLGNIWRFSYVAGENGGAAFLLIYIACVLLLGIPLIVSELAVGRRAHGDAIAAFSATPDERRWRPVGALGIINASLVLSFYSVVAGWALMYFRGAASGALWTVEKGGYGQFFTANIAGVWQPVVSHLLMMLAAALIVAGGIRSGIEIFNKIAMPALALVVLLLAGFALSLDNAAAGLAFLFRPDWSVLGRPAVYLAAMGQAFFSLSIGMAIFVTYGSYMANQHRIPSSALWCATGDTLLAVVVGVAIFPAVFSFGLDPQQGPQLAFVTLPALFARMPFGHLIGTVFFALLVIAALTSMVSVLEVPVAFVRRVTAWPRQRATWVSALAIFLAGLPAALSFGVLNEMRLGGRGVLDTIDFVASDLLLPISAFFVALFVGWQWSPDRARHHADFGPSVPGRVWHALVRLFAPAAIALILLRGLGLL